jgi:hypothetical protein
MHSCLNQLHPQTHPTGRNTPNVNEIRLIHFLWNSSHAFSLSLSLPPWIGFGSDSVLYTHMDVIITGFFFAGEPLPSSMLRPTCDLAGIYIIFYNIIVMIWRLGRWWLDWLLAISLFFCGKNVTAITSQTKRW